MNEVNYHLLESTLVHMHFTKGPVGGKTEGGATNGASGHAAAADDGSAQLAGLSATAKKIYQVLHTSPSGNEGLHVHDIAQRAGLEFSEVEKAGDEMLNAGIIYPTVDDQTWQLLNQNVYG